MQPFIIPWQPKAEFTWPQHFCHPCVFLYSVIEKSLLKVVWTATSSCILKDQWPFACGPKLDGPWQGASHAIDTLGNNFEAKAVQHICRHDLQFRTVLSFLKIPCVFQLLRSIQESQGKNQSEKWLQMKGCGEIKISVTSFSKNDSNIILT